MDWVEGIGISVEEAKSMALEALGVHEDDAEFEVLAEAKLGLFNRVKEKARVRVRVKPATPRAKDDRRRRRSRSGSKDSHESSNRGEKSSNNGGRNQRKSSDSRPQTDHKSDESAPKKKSGGQQGRNRKKDDGRDAAPNSKDENMETMTLVEQADVAEAFVTGLAAEFGQTVTFERRDVDENEIRITVNGDILGRMIGRHGATANAIDELVRTVLQRQAGGGRDGRVRIDIGGVASRREDALRAFCVKIAAQVRESGKEVALEPMRGSDRKVVHDAMTSEDGVGTISEGEDPNRRVVVVTAGNDD